jgi:hypothetical protein
VRRDEIVFALFIFLFERESLRNLLIFPEFA